MAQALTKVEHGVPVTEIAADLKVSWQAVYKLMKAANGLKKAEAKIWHWKETENVGLARSSLKTRSACQSINQGC